MRREALLAALGDGGPLADAQGALLAARAAWRDDPAAAALSGALADYGAGAAGDPLGDGSLARAAVDGFVRKLLPALAANPLGHLPFRHGFDAKTGSLLLARAGRALLSLIAREPGRYERRAIGFDGGERHELVLAGRGLGRVVRRCGTALRSHPRPLAEGVSIRLGPTDEALLVDRVEVRLVSLRLDRLPVRPPPLREYALASGDLLHQSASDPDESRAELAFAVLGRMGRADAAPAMAAIARDGAGSDHLRWQALRECLGLDTRAGLAALRAIAAGGGDPLRGPARALLDRLCTEHPALAAFEPA